MDLEIEQKDNKVEILENKKRRPDFKILEELNKFCSNELSNQEKNDRNMNRLNKTLTNHKHIKN